MITSNELKKLAASTPHSYEALQAVVETLPNANKTDIENLIKHPRQNAISLEDSLTELNSKGQLLIFGLPE